MSNNNVYVFTIQARVQDFVWGGGGQNLKAFFFAFQFLRGGGSSENS